jgi:competence protein ComEC
MLKLDTNTELDLRGLLLVVLAGGWLVGIVLASWLALQQVCFLVLGVLALVGSGIFWHKPLVRWSALALLCFCLGGWRYTLVSPAGDTHAIGAFISPHMLELLGSIADEPRLESHSTLLTVNTQSISLDKGKTWQEVHGEVQVQVFEATFDNPYGPHYGDTVQLAGRLLAPPSYGTPELLASMAFPRIRIIDQGGNPLLVLLNRWRTAMAAQLMRALPQPFAALLIALLLSLRSPPLKPLIPLFNETGTAHLIAPSGFKVTLLAGLINTSTRWLVPRQNAPEQFLLPAQRRRGNWRHWLRTGLVVLSLAIYTFLSGGGPAALRAGIMGLLLVIAPRLERFYNVYTALALTTLLMSLADPFVLWDSGFQLSFVGTLSIVLFTPFFKHILRFLGYVPLGRHIAEILAVTLAAQIATLPIFALSFNEISLVAPLTNMATVPLLETLLVLGGLICLGGLFSLQLALICGWLAWPLLWYITTIITWSASLLGAYLPVDHLNPIVAWGYYALLAWVTTLLFSRWQPTRIKERLHATPLLSQHTKHLIQGGLALLTILATGAVAQATQPDGRMTITLLTTGNPTQGEAIFLRSPDGQTALIDEGADNTTLARTLDASLPFWQRSLNLVILSDTSASNLAGLQDVISRYQVAQVVDAGMLHPSVAYARWRRTLDERHLLSMQARQGTTISLGNQVTFQVLWPTGQLHKSSNEGHDNALILRLLAPGLSMLLLNSAALSDYALKNLPASRSVNHLPAEIVQINSEAGKAVPTSLPSILALAHPSLLLVMPIPARKSKNQATSAVSTAQFTRSSEPWQVLQSGQVGRLEISSNDRGWNIFS